METKPKQSQLKPTNGTVEPFMVFKELNELPNSMKHLAGRVPAPKQMVKVLEVINKRFIKIQFSIENQGKCTCTLLITHFRTPAKHKLRERLLKMKHTPQIEKAISRL